MGRFLAAWALLSLAAAELAKKVIRFEDGDGVVRYGHPIQGSTNKAIPLKGNDVFESLELDSAAVVEVKRLLAPVPMPPAIMGIGLNYWGHINSTHLEAPKTPSLFFKNRFAYNHPGAPIIVPPVSTRPDYEGELGFVIGKNCKDVSEDEALDCVLGYTVCNDFSARCLQAEKAGCVGNGGQFSYSKGLDTHAPIGPALVPTAELGDASGLRLMTFVNNETTPRQNESTSELIFGIKKIVSFISGGTTLEKGTVFCSGTPDGVGDTMTPSVYMQDGDVVKITIEKIGTLINPIVRPGVAVRETPVDLDILV